MWVVELVTYASFLAASRWSLRTSRFFCAQWGTLLLNSFTFQCQYPIFVMHSPQKQKIVQMMTLFKGKILERPKNIPQSWVCLAKHLHMGPWWTHLCDGGVTPEQGDSYCYPHFLGNSLCTEKWTGLRQKFTFCTLRPNYAKHVRLSFAAWWTCCSWTLGTLVEIWSLVSTWRLRVRSDLGRLLQCAFGFHSLKCVTGMLCSSRAICIPVWPSRVIGRQEKVNTNWLSEWMKGWVGDK